MEERLQKVLAAAGVASRREAEEYITAGRVKVNGKVSSRLTGIPCTGNARPICCFTNPGAW